MNCLICGKEIPKGATIDDCLIITGITEDGESYQGYVFIDTLDCFLELKKRVFKNRHGRKHLFTQ